MKSLIGSLIGLMLSVSVSAESLLEGRVRLASGEPVADAQVRIFDLSDLRQGAIAHAMTDGTGYFALPLAALVGTRLPERFALGPNYPNPFNPSTIIPYQLVASSEVRLEVFNLLGQRIATLVDGERPAGFHTATWNATDAADRAVGAGVYIYRMTVDMERHTGRMVLLDGQAGLSAVGVSSVMPGASSVVGSSGAESQVYGLIVSGAGLAPYVDSSFRVESGMAPLELVVSSGHWGGKAADDDCAFCDLFDALNDDEEGPSPSGKAQAVLEAPPAPTNLRFDAPTDSSCTVRWDAAAGATDYDVNYKPAVGGRWTNEPHRGTGLYNTINDLEPDTEYRWAVRAENGDGYSAWVFGPNFTTLAKETDETPEEEEEETQEEEEEEKEALIVYASISKTSLAAGQAFRLNASVRNQGTEGFQDLVLSYYRSNNSTISTLDMLLGTDEVGSLAASSISRNESISLTAPSTPGTYYYGACVASVSDESNTDNNCSSAVRITVSEQVTTEEEADDGVEEEGSEIGEGDMIVSASVNDNILTTGQAFILRATVQNQGTDESPELVLSYYHSSNATITTQDTQVGTDEVGSLAASSIRNESIRLTAPSTPGTYYYGACAASVSDESDTSINCSTGVSVTVEEEDETDGQNEDFVFTDPQIYNDNLFVLPVTENLAAGRFPLHDYAARFYEYFNDEFDFLIFIPTLSIDQLDPGAFIGAYYLAVKNNVKGIGLSVFSDHTRYGSAGKLQGVIGFSHGIVTEFRRGLWDSEHLYSNLIEGPLLHELMHRWVNYIVPTSYNDSHWGFSSANGVLGGFDLAGLVENGSGRYSASSFFNPVGVYNKLCSPIELYLAGFIPPEEVPDLWVAEDGEPLFDGGDINTSWDFQSFVASRVKTYMIEDIIAEHGPRIPDHTQSQKDFRAAVILLISEDYPATRWILENLTGDVSLFSYAGEDQFDLWYNFYEAMGGKATITMDDLSHFQRRASAKRLVPSSFGTPSPPIVDRRE